MSWTKDPSAELDFSFDWTPWLATGETIGDHVLTVSPGLTVAPAGKVTTVDGGKVTVWLGGGTAGQRYHVACRITTSAGRIDERTRTVDVMDR